MKYYAVPEIRKGMLLPIVSIMMMVSGPITAEELKFIPRTSVEFSVYDFTQSARPNALADSGINNNEFPEVNFNVTFKIPGLGGTILKNGYYFDVSCQDSFDEEDSFSLTDPLIPLPGGDFTETFEGDHRNYAVTVGKKILENRGGIYAGFKVGKSHASVNQGEALSFEEKSFFAGAIYGWSIASQGVFSLNLAFADLDGDLKEDVTNPLFTALPVLLSMDATSDAQGLSYGASWSSRLTQKLSYSLALDAKKYTFDNVTDKNPAAIPSNEFEEEFFGATFSLFYLI